MDEAITVIQDYIQETLFEPESDWPKSEFYARCYARWAANEILERLIKEDMKLPSYLTGKKKRRPFDIIKEFIDEMDYYSEIGECKQSRYIFAIAKNTAIDIILLFL